VDEHLIAGDPRRERVDAEFTGEGEHMDLGGPDVRSAGLHDGAAADLVVERAASNAPPRLQHHDGAPGAAQLPSGGQPGQPGADDRDVDPARWRRGALVGGLHGAAITP
jgi:hypothetical protein